MEHAEDQGLVRGSRIYLGFCYWISEGFYTSFMYKSIFLPFTPLIFYYPLYMLKNLNDMPWSLT